MGKSAFPTIVILGLAAGLWLVGPAPADAQTVPWQEPPTSVSVQRLDIAIAFSHRARGLLGNPGRPTVRHVRSERPPGARAARRAARVTRFAIPAAELVCRMTIGSASTLCVVDQRRRHSAAVDHQSRRHPAGPSRRSRPARHHVVGQPGTQRRLPRGLPHFVRNLVGRVRESRHRVQLSRPWPESPIGTTGPAREPHPGPALLQRRHGGRDAHLIAYPGCCKGASPRRRQATSRLPSS